MLTINRLACVAPEVDLRECTLNSPPQKQKKAEPTLALKSRGDVTRNQNPGYQWPQKRRSFCVRLKTSKIKNKDFFVLYEAL